MFFLAEIDKNGNKEFIKLRIQPTKMIYDKEFIERIKKFFELNAEDEYLKSSTWEKIE